MCSLAQVSWRILWSPLPSEVRKEQITSSLRITAKIKHSVLHPHDANLLSQEVVDVSLSVRLLSQGRKKEGQRGVASSLPVGEDQVATAQVNHLIGYL